LTLFSKITASFEWVKGFFRGRQEPKLLPGQIAGTLQPTPYPSRTDWPQDVIDLIEDEQGDAYRKLARMRQLKGGAEAAFDLIAEKPKPTIDRETFRREEEPGTIFNPENYANTQSDLMIEQRMPLLSLTLEDPLVRRRWWNTYHWLEERCRSGWGVELHLNPYIATLPYWDFNARVHPTRKNKNQVLFFDYGLSRYLLEFAALACWIVPPFPPLGHLNDQNICRITGPHTIPYPAIAQFHQFFDTYATDGFHDMNTPLMPLPLYNAHIYQLVLANMFAFIMAHEQSHIRLGHFANERFGREPENEADGNAAFLISALADANGESWAFPFWCADLVLIAFRMLDRKLSVMSHNTPDLAWINPHYLEPEDRRRNLRNFVPGDIHPISIQATGNLLGMNDSLFKLPEEQTVYAAVWGNSPEVRKSYEGMVKFDPSPLWRKRVNGTYRPRPDGAKAPQNEGTSA